MTPLIGNIALDENGVQIQVEEKVPLFDENGEPILTKKGKQKEKKVFKDLYYEAGDFRSDMSLKLLKDADIVVTNPPFSLLREYMLLLMANKKKFLIIGRQTAITYKDIYPLIKNQQIWLGNGFSGNVTFFSSPYEDIATSNQKQVGKIRVSGVMWFTNLDHAKRHQILPLDLGYSYNGHEDMYPKYENYEGIDVEQTCKIPHDYKGVMGVPITFLTKYCPEQFEIVGFRKGNDNRDLTFIKDGAPYMPFFRILVRFK